MTDLDKPEDARKLLDKDPMFWQMLGRVAIHCLCYGALLGFVIGFLVAKAIS